MILAILQSKAKFENIIFYVRYFFKFETIEKKIQIKEKDSFLVICNLTMYLVLKLC